MNQFNGFESDTVLGDRYRDEQTGVEGVATCAAFFQHGCERVELEVTSKDKDTGKIEIEVKVFDAPRLTHIETERPLLVKQPGGPDKGAAQQRRSVPSANQRTV